MAVVGNVGTYAQVQPIEGPNFGGMVQAQFDKLDAERKAKEAAKAKAREEAGKELEKRKDPNAYTTSGMTGYDESISKLYKDFYDEATSYKKMYQDTQDTKYLYAYDKVVNEMNTITNEAKGLADYFKTAEDLVKSGKVNEDNYNEVMFDIQQLRDGKAKFMYRDGRGFIQLYNQDGTEREPEYIGGFVKDRLNLVPDIDLNKEYSQIVSRVKAPLIESGNYYSNVKVKDINSKEAEPQRKALLSAAEGLAGTDAAMTKWYQSQVKPTTGIRKTNNWTEEEREQAKNYFFNEMKNSYGKEVERGFGAPRDSSGSGSDKEKAKPTIYNVPGTKGKGLAWSAANKNNPTISSLVVNVGGTGGKKKETINNAVFKNIYMTKSKDGKQFVELIYSMPTGNISRVYTKEEISDLERALNTLRPSDAEYNQVKKELELARESTSGQKQSMERRVVMPVNDEENLGNIANALSYDSTNSLLFDLRELSGFNKQTETIEERKRRLGLK